MPYLGKIKPEILFQEDYVPSAIEIDTLKIAPWERHVPENFQARLREIAKEAGGNRALCEKSGISERTFANWLSGASEPKIIGLSAIANAAGVTIDWIVSGTKPKMALGSRPHNDSEIITIPWIAKTLKDIQGDVAQRLHVLTHMPFSTQFLETRLLKTDFDQLCLLEVHGDSLHPTANCGDFVLVDRSDTSKADGLVSFVFQENILIKRIVNTLNGIEVISDNKALYPSHIIPPEQSEQLDIIGRILWIGKTVL